MEKSELSEGEDHVPESHTVPRREPLFPVVYIYRIRRISRLFCTYLNEFATTTRAAAARLFCVSLCDDAYDDDRLTRSSVSREKIQTDNLKRTAGGDH